jgi:7-cyano-7-deazaguanine synthase in queuosine biosynthesis
MALGATMDSEDAPRHILEGIGWTHEDVQRLYTERQRMIREAQEAYIAERRKDAEGIARQRLEERTKAELAKMAEEYSVHIAQSWRKTEQIEALLGSPEVVEDVAGITQMREHLEEV